MEDILGEDIWKSSYIAIISGSVRPVKVVDWVRVS